MKKRICTLLSLLLCLAMLTACGAANNGKDTPDAEMSGDSAQTETETPDSSSGNTQNPEEPENSAPSASALRFSTVDINGNPVDESILEGYDLIVMNIWAYWCGPCVAELPDIERVYKEYDNVLFLGVLCDTGDMEATKQIVEQAGLTYPILYPGDDLQDLVNAQMYIPASIFFNSKGEQLGDTLVGGRNYDQWKAAVEEHLP